MMRKLTVQVKLNQQIRQAFSFLLEKLESLELLELIKVDFKEGTKVIPSQYHSALVYRTIEPYFIAAGNLAMGQFCRNAYDEAVQKGKRLARMERSRLIEQFIPEMVM